jgi:hypothetical protein
MYARVDRQAVGRAASLECPSRAGPKCGRTQVVVQHDHNAPGTGVSMHLDRQPNDALRQVPMAQPRRISVALSGPPTASVTKMKNESTNRAICASLLPAIPLIFNGTDH